MLDLGTRISSYSQGEVHAHVHARTHTRTHTHTHTHTHYTHTVRLASETEMYMDTQYSSQPSLIFTILNLDNHVQIHLKHKFHQLTQAKQFRRYRGHTRKNDPIALGTLRLTERVAFSIRTSAGEINSYSSHRYKLGWLRVAGLIQQSCTYQRSLYRDYLSKFHPTMMFNRTNLYISLPRNCLLDR